MMYRIILSWSRLIWLLLLLLPACQGKTDWPGSRIAILLSGDARLSQVNGLKTGLSELGYHQGKNVVFDVANAHNDLAVMPRLLENLLSRQPDLMVAAGGLEADLMKRRLKDSGIPVLVLYVNGILERKLVDSRRHPGWEVTGVDNLNAQLSGKRVELLKDLLPGLKKILVLYSNAIEPSRMGLEIAGHAAEKLGLVIDARPVTDQAEVSRIMASLSPGDVDAMLMVPGSPIENALHQSILPHLKRLNLPLMAHSRSMAELGGLAGYGAHFFMIGQQASRLAHKILSGVPARDLPFEVPKQFVYTLNAQVLDDIGVDLNELSRNQIHEIVTTVP